jgi:hypothetical protein
VSIISLLSFLFVCFVSVSLAFSSSFFALLCWWHLASGSLLA